MTMGIIKFQYILTVESLFNCHSKRKTLKQTLSPEKFDRFIPKMTYGHVFDKYHAA